MTVTKIFSKNNDTARIVCPKCEKTVIMNVSKYKDVNKTVEIHEVCDCCGHCHTVILERRRFYRKEVNIPGEYRMFGEKEKLPMVVKDLSRSGFRLAVERELKVGDRLNAEFRLDNKQRTLIKKEVVVKVVFGLEVGTEFISRNIKNPIDKAYDIALGFYTYSR